VSVVSLTDVAFRYAEGDFRLHVPSLSVRPGERVAVIGPSGSGKTTLLQLIAGISQPFSGEVRTLDQKLGALDDARRRDFRIRRLGLVFQEFELLDYLSVLDNIVLPFRVGRGLRPTDAARDRARTLARRVGIGDLLGRSPAKLSHGEKQRVAVCRALVTEPALVLADEPTGNLDPENKLRVLDILIECAAETGAAFIAVTHDHDLLDRFGRVIDFKSFTGTQPVEEIA